MDASRSKSRKGRNKTSRQPSPERLKLNSRLASPAQPEAGPSRLPHEPPVPPAVVAATQQFPSDLDFIALASDEDDQPKRETREWDRGKSDRDWNRNRDGQTAGRKRRREESERDDGSTLRDADAKKSSLKLRKAPWTAYVDWESCRNVAEILHKEVEAYLRYILPTPVEHEVRSMIVQLISSSIKKTYPDAEVLPFGSFGTKLYLPQGDIDLVVQSRTLAYNDKVSALRSLANIVKRTGLADKVTVISKARVPIIKFVTLYGHFAVDISMNQSNGVETGAMINRFLDEFPALRPLVLIVKAFLKYRNLNEVYSGGLGSYAIVCLAVSHLQMHPKVRRAEIDSAKNLGVLLLEFFELYGKYFNYTSTGISLRHGGTYFSKRERGWFDYNRPFLLCIEDPGDISNDISKGSFGIKKVKQTFAGAYEIMLSTIYTKAEILSARQDGRAVDLRRGSTLERSPDEMSVLSSILSIDQETINHRRLVQQVYEEGTLARMSGVDPRAGLFVSAQKNESREKGAESVVAAWGEADMSVDSDSVQDRTPKANGQNGRKRDATGRHEDEEGSRYDIAPRRNGRDDQNQRQGGSVWKRRRAVSAQDVRPTPAATLFVPDDDQDDSDLEDGEIGRPDERLEFYADANPADSSDGLDEIERVYTVAADALGGSDGDDDEDSAYVKGSKGKGKGKGRNNVPKSLRREQRQAFWAAKAMQGIDVDSS